jgi:polyhydroxybutyrate depolymerase
VRSPALAIAWEFRRRSTLVVVAGYALALAAGRLILGPGRTFTLDPPNGDAAFVTVPFATAFLFFLAVFSFGLGGDVAGRRSIFPARMFTLPVTTRALALWPMLFGTGAMASLWLVTAPFVRWSEGPDLPLVWPAFLAAVWLAWTQVLAWMPYGLPGLRVVAAVLWLAALDAAVILAVHFEVPESRLVAMLAPQLPLAYLAAWWALARARRGDVPDWRGAFTHAFRITHAPSPGRERFASPRRAQAWFEWRRHGRVLPALVAILLPFELGLLSLARHEPPILVELTLIAVLLTPPFMAGFTAAFGGTPPRPGDASSGTALTATRPLTNAALVAAKMEAAMWSALGAWLLVLLAVPLALVLTETWAVVADGTMHAIEVIGWPRAIVIMLLAFAGLLASTWKQLVQSLFISLTGRAWIVRTSVLVRLALLTIVGPLADWLFRRSHPLALLWDGWPWILGVLVCLKMSAAAWILPRLHRRRALSERCLVIGAAAWLAVVLALYGVLVWLVCTPPILPRSLPALVAILAVPLVRLSAAPLALAWSRQGGGQSPGEEESRAAPGNGPRVLAAVRVLLAVPVVLVLVEAVSYGVANRSNGTIVSSGEQREYLVHVPRSYDPTRPAPLVISMHGGALRPAVQRDISRWDRLSDRHGFIVVYPAGNRSWGRGPRAWHMSRGGVARNVRFISDLIDALRADYNIDPTRVYADGLSNGGGMAFVLSCALSDRIAAVGLVASAQFLPFDWCAGERGVPMIAFHGTADRGTPYHGGSSWVAPEFRFPDIPTWTADWARRNRCGPDPVESAAAPDVTRREYSNCADDADVVLHTVRGGGHSWPGGGLGPEWLTGPTSHSVDATAEMWAFFRAHPLRPR